MSLGLKFHISISFPIPSIFHHHHSGLKTDHILCHKDKNAAFVYGSSLFVALISHSEAVHMNSNLGNCLRMDLAPASKLSLASSPTLPGKQCEKVYQACFKFSIAQ